MPPAAAVAAAQPSPRQTKLKLEFGRSGRCVRGLGASTALASAVPALQAPAGTAEKPYIEDDFFFMDFFMPMCSSDLGVVMIQPTKLTGVAWLKVMPWILLPLLALMSLGG